MVDSFDNGQDAWRASKKQRYDFIILDWKIPELSSLALFNRLKSDANYKNTPILVISGFLNKKDFSLLNEFPNTTNIEKPFAVKFLIKKMQLLKKEAQWYVQQEGEIERILQDMQEKKNISSQELSTMIHNSPNPLPLALFFGKALRGRNLYRQAEDILKLALRYNDNIVALSELGKVYLHTGRNKEAMQVLARAAQKSPDNLERICHLADLHLQSLDTDSAAHYFEQALAIDPENDKANSGKSLVHSIDKWLVGTATIPDTFAGILNAIGINMVRSGNINAGIDHYNSALKHVDDDISKARLAFNLGLGFLRCRKPEEALSWFETSLHFFPQFTKADKYISILKKKYLSSHPGCALSGEIPEAAFLDDDNFEVNFTVGKAHSENFKGGGIGDDLDEEIEMF